MVNHTRTVKYRCTNAHIDGVLWDGVRGEVEETQQQVSGSAGNKKYFGVHPRS